MKYFLLFFVVALVSCYKETKKTPTNNNVLVEMPVSKKLDNKEVPENRLTLSTTPESLSLNDNIEGNLFGKFHCDRAQFYIIKNPQNDIFNSKVESITLYYLDSALCKTKYILKQDITAQLLKQFGSFRITGFDFENRDIISSGAIVTKSGDEKILNPALNNYELNWTFGTKEIRYRVNLESTEHFIYLEKEKTYEQKYKRVESYCI